VHNKRVVTAMAADRGASRVREREAFLHLPLGADLVAHFPAARAAPLPRVHMTTCG